MIHKQLSQHNCNFKICTALTMAVKATSLSTFGNQLIHIRLTKTKPVGGGKDLKSLAGRQP